ncbi:ABC transporter permease [Bacillus cytotoxicus]|uniref:ABC transporter permease n=1 Tax=Bacillus cereus group sp. BfR-BA-01492 TaxID=2920361 RepID=UPI001F55C146|nr:ABC transporter permease [Bacillus cereus group sp. BfR-BA-01492]EMA6344304.1 ABC transporter permease [Bacillus cytotoxicus]EMA6345361.1 ABC transporter permease [Bacillus cytotoxicus]
MIKEQFKKRLYNELYRKWKSIRSVTDWTVALYLIIPAFIFSGIYYRSLWEREIAREETTYFLLGLFMFYCVIYSRGVRSFFERADCLFFIQYPVHMQKLMRYGMLYTFVRISITNVILIVFMLPLCMKNIGASPLQIVLVWGFCTVFRFMLSLLVRYINVCIGKRWVLWIVSSLLFFICFMYLGYGIFFILKSAVYSIVFIIVPVLICVACIKQKVNYKKYFFKEIEKEKEESMRWTRGIMQVGGHVTNTSSSSKKPWLFPRSKKFLGEKSDSRIVESFLKEFFRTGSSLRFYVQIVFISTISIMRTPWWITAIILIFALFAISRYSHDYWHEFTKKMFLHLYCEESKLLLLKWRATQYLLLPAIFIYATVILAQFYLLPAIFVGILIAVIVGWILFLPEKKSRKRLF